MSASGARCASATSSAWRLSARCSTSPTSRRMSGKQDLGLAAIETMRPRHVRSLAKFLDDQPSASDYLAHALTVTFDKRDGQALIRLLADPTVGASPELGAAVKQWLADIQAAGVNALRTDEHDQKKPRLAGELTSIVRARSATVLGHALLGLSSWIPLTPDQTP